MSQLTEMWPYISKNLLLISFWCLVIWKHLGLTLASSDCQHGSSLGINLIPVELHLRVCLRLGVCFLVEIKRYKSRIRIAWTIITAISVHSHGHPYLPPTLLNIKLDLNFWLIYTFLNPKYRLNKTTAASQLSPAVWNAKLTLDYVCICSQMHEYMHRTE